MSANTRSGSKRSGLRSSTKLKVISNQSNSSKSKSKKSPASRKKLSAPAAVPIPDVSKSDNTDATPLEADSKKNGSLKRLNLFENDNKNAVDVPTNDTEISPLRSNRVSFAIQSKRKKLTVASESGTKRTKKYKENFDAFFEDSTKIVNNNHDAKLSLPPNEKNLQESDHINEQSSTGDNIETLDHHSAVESNKESQATNSNANNISDMVTNVLSNSVFQNGIPDPKSVLDIAECSEKRNKPCFVKSFDLIEEKGSGSVGECNVSEQKSGEFQQSQINRLNQKGVKNKKQELNERSHLIHHREFIIKTRKQRLIENGVENMKKELNKAKQKKVEELSDISIKNIDFKLSKTDVKNINLELNGSDTGNTDLELNESIKNISPELNESIKNISPALNESIKNIRPELNESIKNISPELNESIKNISPELNESIKNISPELNESVKNFSPELNETRIRNIDSNLNRTDISNKDLKLNETSISVNPELDKSDIKNIDEEFNETDVKNIDTEFNENNEIIDPEFSESVIKNIVSELSEIVENIELKLNCNNKGNTKQELKKINSGNIMEELNETCMGKADQELNVTDKVNEGSELDLSSAKNIELKFNNDSVKLIENEVNGSYAESVRHELNTNCVKNVIQEVTEIVMENTEQKFNGAILGKVTRKLKDVSMGNTNQELDVICSSSSANIDQDLNKTTISIVDQKLTEIDIRTMKRELDKVSIVDTSQKLSISKLQNPEREPNNINVTLVNKNLNESSMSSAIQDLIESSIETVERLSSNNMTIELFNESHMEHVERMNENQEETTEQLNLKLIDSLVSKIEDGITQELKKSEVKSKYNFEQILKNIYRFNRKNYKNRKEVRRLLCECTWDDDEYLPEIIGCGEECLNRLLMIECGSRCRVGDKCSNKRFQKREYASTEPFETQTKGIGLKMAEDVKLGSFIIEFVGELVNGPQFRQRVKKYARENTVHHYFMAISNDEIIDATQMGNFSRFINHSCDPNCETQKWTVNGEIRVGFFAKRDIKNGEELTFDYKFQIYGREAQKCFCGTEKCKGYIGEVKPMLIDSSSGNKSSNRRKKAVEDKRREIFEDFSVEKEVEKLCENGCLRNREDTLLFARLMVRVEDVKTRQKLLDVILKTTEQACLRMFIDYHGLSLIWSWMVDGTNLNLRYKILEVFSALPLPNKTILIRSKVLKEVEKWSVVPPNEVSSENVEIDADNKDSGSDNKDSEKHKFSEIIDLACKLLDSWKLLKEEFRIPRVEEQKKNISNTDADNAQSKDCGDTASPKLSDESKSLEQTNTIKYKEDGKTKSSTASDSTENTSRSKKSVSSDTFGVKQKNLNKNERRQLFAASVAQLLISKQASLKDVPKDSTPGSGGSWTPGTPNSDHSTQPPQERTVLLPTPVFTEPPPSCAANMQLPTTLQFPSASQPLPSVPPPLIFPPPNISVPPPQLPFLGIPPPALPPSANPVAGPSVPVPPPSSSWPLDPSSSSAMYRPPMFPPPPPTGINYSTQPPPAIPLPYQSTSTEAGVPAFTPLTNCQNSQFLSSQPSANGTRFEATTCHVIPDEDGYISLKIKLPTNWKAAVDGQGNIYFYNIITRKTKWHPPLFADDSPEDDDSTPTSDDPQDSTELSVMASTSEQKSSNEEKLDESVSLPPDWRSTKDPEGQLYYYNVITRETQWDPPPFKKCKMDGEDENEIDYDDDDDDDNIEETIDEDTDSTPLLDEPRAKHSKEHRKRKIPEKKRMEKEVASPQEASTSQEYSKRRIKKMPAKEITPPQEVTPPEETPPSGELTPTLDTVLAFGSPFEGSPSQEADSSLGAKKIRDKFKAKLSAFVIRCLSQYRKSSCKRGRIADVTDFRYLARKLTHCLIHKEMRHCKNIEDLHYSEIVRNKANDFIEKYMGRYGPLYKSDKKK